jgi:DNA-binding NtrC family response regulator
MNDKKRILIVDDEEPIRRLLARGLAGFPAEMVFGTCASDAVEKMDSGAFDFLITDLKLPDKDGTFVIANFHKRFPGRTVVVITGLLEPEGLIRNIAKDHNCQVLSKPFQLEEIQNAIFNDKEQKKAA